jgi:hypothetical protein
MNPITRMACAGCCAILASPLLPAQESDHGWSLAGYVQQSWPKQTETNRQIKDEINGALGTNFKTWADVANINLGAVGMKKLAPHWNLGFEADWSAGQISGTESVADFGFGPGEVAFKQRYSTYADLQLMTQFRPLGCSGRWDPFLAAAVGLAYDKDYTTLTFAGAGGGPSALLLRVDNHGFFPILNCGIGVDYFLSSSRVWFIEAEAGYSWCRLKHQAQAAGLEAPAPRVTADSDSTGPNVLLGVGCHF